MSDEEKKQPDRNSKNDNSSDELKNIQPSKDQEQPDQNSSLEKDGQARDPKKDSADEKSGSTDSEEQEDNRPEAGDEKVDPYDSYYEEGYDEDDEAHDDFVTAEIANNQEGGMGGNGSDDSNDIDEEDIPPDNPEKKMPFLDHLEELRWTILWSLVAILVSAVGCYIFAKEIIDILLKPLPEGKSLIFLSPTGGFMIYIKVSIFSGLIVALPFVVWQFWKFIVPGLLEKEKKIVPAIVFFTVLCFAIGAAFAYFVIIPFGLKFLLGFETEAFQATIEIGKYLGFVVTIILVFGTVFELPVLSFFLTKIGILNPEFLRSKRRYGIVIIFIMAAMLTPPDIFTQLMLAGPLVLLYEISIWVSSLVHNRQESLEGQVSGSDSNNV